ncbi:WD40-repeat-containing domain protein [Lentinula novae-zelandiae]|nr:WD40-repeat-containing domain protein [Lentinula novae-zelandiae]
MSPISITSDEINRLIYAYFRDSGFEHSAYTLVKEAQLERSPVFKKHVPRGELVELLSKSLLYNEVECHFQGGEAAIKCKAMFSLLEPHTCSPNPPESHTFLAPTFAPPLMMVAPPIQSNVLMQDVSHRKISPLPRNITTTEKRTRKESNDMDSSLFFSPPPSDLTAARPKAADHPKKPASKPKKLLQGPIDDITDPNVITLMPGHATEVFVCAFNPVNYNLLASGSKDAVVKIWTLSESMAGSAQAGEPITIDSFSQVESADLTCLSWSPDGTLLAIASYDSRLRICDTAGKMYLESDIHKGPIFTTRFSTSGRWLLTASLDGSSCLWDVAGKKLHRQYHGHKDVDWLNNDLFASCGADRQVHIFSVDEEKSIKTFGGHTDEINQIKCNPSGTRLASCSDDMTTRIWNVSNISASIPSEADSIPGLGSSDNDQVTILEGHKHSVSTIGWYQPPGTENELIATGSFDGATRLWDSVTGRCLHAFADHKRPVYALDISPDNHWLTTGGGDGWLHVYDLKTQTRIWSWFAGADRPGVFEIDWQTHKSQNIERIAMALECRLVGVIDLRRVPAIANLRGS